METTLSGLLGTGRGSEVPTTAASLGFLSGTSKGERPDRSWGEAGAANENTQEIVVLAGLAAGTLRQVKGQRGGGGDAPADTCVRPEPFCLQSSELEDVVLEEDRHFLFMLAGTLQLSKYLRISTPQG